MSLLITMLFSDILQGQTGEININRKAVVAGSFYSNDAKILQSEIEKYFSQIAEKEVGKVRALIVPHAGYIYSGKVASVGYRQLKGLKFNNVFIIGSSHRMHFKGASIYSQGDYETPLGKVIVNRSIASDLITSNKHISFFSAAHQSEHSIEVQLPFLQILFGEKLQIIPIVIGSQDPVFSAVLAKTLQPYFTEENLFVISSDFSHYPTYDDAKQWDIKTLQSILTGKPDEFIKSISTSDDDFVSGLSTRSCGWSSVLTLMNLAKKQEAMRFVSLEYKNSGDSKFGDKQRVVGYHAIALVEEEVNNFRLSLAEKTTLLEIARNTLENKLNAEGVNGKSFAPVITNSLKYHCGAFVTLKKNHQLRGCIGQFSADKPLHEVVQDMSIAAATADPRFMPVSKQELQDIEIEISVLTPLQLIEDVGEIVLGKHGIYLKKNGKSGTFLPQVATETGWNLEEFLGHCARDKAGIGWEGWKDAEIYVYEAIIFDESGH